jgi:hypothetical protein
MAPPQLTVGKKPAPAGPYIGTKTLMPKIPKPLPPMGGVVNGGPYIGTYPAGGLVDPNTGTGGTFTAPPVTPPGTKPKVQNPYGADRPDLSKLISGDWEVQDAETAMASRMSALRDSFQANVRRALIDLGVGDTSKLGKFGSYVDSDTIQQAIANKYSANAQIQQSQERASNQMQAALAGRGMLASGQLTKSSGDIAADAEKSRYDALQSFLGSGEEGLRGLGDAEYDLGQGVAKARAAAAQRASAYDLGWLDWQAGNQDETPTTGPAATAPTSGPAAAPVAAPAPAPRAPVETPAARALRLRSEALNKLYGLGETPAQRALRLRSQALNKRYGL